MRTGLGIDTHRFAEGRRLILGGVEIPHTAGLDGHSDADVLAHAITDAILGAASMGDIGTHFPDTDPDFKDADSIELLREVVRRVAANGWRVEHVDATVMLERPKLAPHREAIMARLSRGRRRLRARQGDHRRAHGVRRPRGGRRGDGGRHAGSAGLTLDAGDRAEPEPAREGAHMVLRALEPDRPPAQRLRQREVAEPDRREHARFAVPGPAQRGALDRGPERVRDPGGPAGPYGVYDMLKVLEQSRVEIHRATAEFTPAARPTRRARS